MSKSVGHSIIKGSAISVGSRWIMRLIGLVNTIIVARMLSPEDVGIVGISVTVVWILEGISNLRINDALIVEDKTDRSYYDSAFALSLLRALILSVLVYFGASWVGSWVDDPRVIPVIQASALICVLIGFANPKFIEFERQMDFSKLFIRQSVSKLTSVVVTIALVITYKSYWALIIGMISANLVSTLISYWLLPYMPSVSTKRIPKIWKFSSWLTYDSVVFTLSNRLDTLLVGSFLGVQMSGFSYIGEQIARMPTTEFFHPIRSVLFIGISKFKSDFAKLRANSLETLSVSASIILPVAVGVSLVSDEFVYIFFGEKWAPVIPYLQYVLIGLGVAELSSVALSIAMVQKKTKQVFVRTFVNACIRLPLTVLGILYYGFMGLIVARVISDVIDAIYKTIMLRGLVDIGLKDMMGEMNRALLSVCVMAACVYLYNDLLSPSGSTLLLLSVDMLAEVIIGALAYIGCHFLLWVMQGKPQGIEIRGLETMSTIAQKVGFKQ